MRRRPNRSEGIGPPSDNIRIRLGASNRRGFSFGCIVHAARTAKPTEPKKRKGRGRGGMFGCQEKDVGDLSSVKGTCLIRGGGGGELNP